MSKRSASRWQGAFGRAGVVGLLALLGTSPARSQDAASAAAAAPAAATTGAPAAAGAVNPPGLSAAAPVASPGAEVREVYFDQDLDLSSDLMLQGITAIETVSFRVSDRWQLNADPVLEVHFDHSDSLDPKRSSLVVSVNNMGLATVTLTPENARDGKISVRVPRSLLYDGGYNDLKFKVVQHIEDECEDPFDPALWTRVSLDSKVTFAYTPLPVTPELADFPQPYFDPLGYGPMEIALAGVQELGVDQLDAVGLVGFAFGRHADYRGVKVLPPVADPATAQSHVLVVGTPDKNPLVARYVDRATLRPGVGTIVSLPNPSNPKFGVLVITGGDANGVLSAAEALSSDDRYELLSGGKAEIVDIEDVVPPKSRRKPAALPFARSGEMVVSPLKDIGVDDRTVRGFYAPPIQVPLHLEGDAQVQIDGARVAIDYAYGADLDTRLSTMEVRLDDVTLRSVALNRKEGEEKTRLWVDLPFELMQPDSRLEIIFHLFPINFDPCVYVNDRHIWGTVFASSEVHVARDRIAELPNLSLLKYDLWPLNTALTDDGLVVVVGDKPSATDASAAMQLLAELGGKSQGDRPAFRVVSGGSAFLEDKAPEDLVLLVSEGGHAAHKALTDRKLVSTAGDLDRLATDDGKKVLEARNGSSLGTVEQVVLRGGLDGRTALILRASTADGLLNLLHDLQNPSILGGLGGAVSVVDGGTEIRQVDLGSKVTVGNRTLASQLKQSIRGSWGLLGMGVLISAVLLAMIVQGWASRRGGHTG